MAHVFQTFARDGKAHPRWKFRFVDHTGRRKTLTGTSGKAETIKLAERREAFEKEIRDGVRKAPQRFDHAQAYEDRSKEYLDWGKTQGGRNGFGWSKVHLKNRTCYLKWWKEQLTLRTIQDITLAAVEKKVKELHDAGKARNTVVRYCESIGAFCEWCVTRGYLETDPLAQMKNKAAEPETPFRELTADELRRLFEVAPARRALWYRVALATGYRLSELRALKVKSLDLFGPSLPLAAEFCKNRKDARQPITKALAEELQQVTKDLAPTDSLLDMPSKDAVGEQRVIDFTRAKIFDNDEGKAGFHSLRVIFVNQVVRSGADLKTAMELSRHSTPKLTMRTYAKTDAVRMRKAVSAVESYVQAVQSPTGAKRTIAVGGGDPASVEGEEGCTAGLVITPLGFEPR